MKSPSLADIGTVVLACCAVALVGMAGYNQFRPKGPKDENVKDWEMVATTGNRLGPATSKVTIVEFTDYDCPYCRTADIALTDLLKQYPENVSLVVRHFPITQRHPNALKLAVAAECSAFQGKFVDFHHALFASQTPESARDLGALAHSVGIADTSALMTCIARMAPLSRVAADTAAGRKLNIVGTPYVLVNGRVFYGDTAKFSAYVRSLAAN